MLLSKDKYIATTGVRKIPRTSTAQHRHYTNWAISAAAVADNDYKLNLCLRYAEPIANKQTKYMEQSPCLASNQEIPCILQKPNVNYRRSQWPRGLRRRSAAARPLRLWVRIPPVAWMSVCCESCVLSGRGLCDELITRPEESYRLWCVVVCDLETSWMRRPWHIGGCFAKIKKY